MSVIVVLSAPLSLLSHDRGKSVYIRFDDVPVEHADLWFS